MIETKQLHFSVEGEYITMVAREKLYRDRDLASAVRILRSSLISDRISPDEQLILCLQILHGAASIKGRSGTDSYRVEVRDDIEERPTDLSNIAGMLLDMKKQTDRLEKENRDLASRFFFLSTHLDKRKLTSINNDYYEETGEPMFPDMKIRKWMADDREPDDMLSSFLAQRRRENERQENGEELEDYGWLEPNGTFHPVAWGQHETWAGNWLKEYRPFSEYPDLYWHTDEDGCRHYITGGDVLVYSLGWILLHSPWQGLAEPTKDPDRKLTKAQKEFLFDCFTKQGRAEKADALYKD